MSRSRQIRRAAAGARAKRTAAEQEATEQEEPKYERRRDLARRYQVTERTIDRWTAAGILPPPLRVLRFKFWPPNTEAKTGDATP
jgi:hypothetical protein